MAAEDELVLPQVPEAKPEDPEDVSWALSTAEAMWARGDHLEGIKWIRKAAEAASDAEDDMRALELAKAASELTTIVARKSHASLHEGPGQAGGAPPEHTPMAAPVAYAASSARPASPAAGSAPPVARSAPPIPLPSKASQAPSALAKSPQPPRGAPRPFSGPPPSQGTQVSPMRPAEVKPKKRKSRENMDHEARAAASAETAARPADGGARGVSSMASMDNEVTAHGADFGLPLPQNARSKRRSRPEPEPTVIARLEDLDAAKRRSAAEWDASPTQNLTGPEFTADGEIEPSEGDRMTAFAAPPIVPAPSVPPAAKSPSIRPPIATVHDPEIQTSQAVRVVVWRDASGVHIAPAGTVVSSITIDAVLVALEPSADLTAWLSARDR